MCSLQPLAVFLVPPKIIYVSKRIELTFPSVSNKPPFISFYYIVPCNQQGSQIRICNKSFNWWLYRYYIGKQRWNKRSIKWCISFTRSIGMKVLKLSEIHNKYYYSFKIFPRFWLVKSTLLIHHNQLLMTKFGRILCLATKWRQKCSILAG